MTAAAGGSLWALPLLPVAGAALLFVLRRYRWSCLTVPTVTMAATLVAAVMLANVAEPFAAGRSWWGPRLSLTLALVGPGRIMAMLVPLVALPVVAYAATSMRRDAALPRLLILLLVFTGAMELLVCASDFLTLLIGWELVGACSWGLIGHDWRDAARPAAARDAFLTTRIGDLGLYIAAAAAIGATGSLDFSALDTLRQAPGDSSAALQVIAGGVLLAAAAKSAQLPFSPWLFSAMKGPTAASALLHSATMVAAGAYILARLQPALAQVEWFGTAVAALGLATALAGGIVASLQSDLKRALAASTSAQYGLMFVAVGAGFPPAAGLHLVAHAMFKALLFLGAGVALHAASTLDLGALSARRLGRTLPAAAALFAVGALALGGLPPLGAAFSKERILAAAGASGAMSRWLGPGVVIAGLLSAFYAARLVLLAFDRRAGGDPAAARAEAPTVAAPPSRAEMASMALLAALSIALGIVWLPGAPLAATLAAGPLPAGAPWELVVSLSMVTLGAAAAWWMRATGTLVVLRLPVGAQAALSGWMGLPAAARWLVVSPTLALSRLLAIADDRVVDAGIRFTGYVAGATSRLLAWRGEPGVDAIVVAAVRLTRWSAALSAVADDRGVDGAVEQVARGIGAAGSRSRTLQTGMTHHYYLIVAIGILVIAAVAGVANHLFALRFSG